MMRILRKQFDGITTRCVVEAMLNQGVSPDAIYAELHKCPSINSGVLMAIIEEFAPGAVFYALGSGRMVTPICLPRGTAAEGEAEDVFSSEEGRCAV